jgi:F-type H+-transporting ATPase subunit a
MNVHIPPLAAETIFYWSNFPVTNTLINSVIATLLIGVGAWAATRRLQLVPRGWQSVVEIVIETILGYMDRVTQSRAKSVKFLPLVGTLFIFIFISNLLGILPGVGTIMKLITAHGEIERLPVFRPANTDLNLTLAMAVSAVVASHVFGIIAIGGWKYFNRFVKLSDLWHSLRKGGVSILVAVIELGVGFIEIISELAKMVSLSLRLFGNVFAGEVLLTVFAGLAPVIVPLPFLLMETLVAAVQATVFSMLTLVYLTIATTEVKAEHA